MLRCVEDDHMEEKGSLLCHLSALRLPIPSTNQQSCVTLGSLLPVSGMASASSPAVFAEKLELTVLWLLLAKRHFIQVLIK